MKGAREVVGVSQTGERERESVCVSEGESVEERGLCEVV